MRKIVLLFGLFVLCVQAFAIDPFTLKGKTIIIPPCCRVGKMRPINDNFERSFFKCNGSFDNVYAEASLKHFSFDEKNKVKKGDIYGKELFVEDVIFRDKRNEKRAVLMVVKVDETRYVLHFPLFMVESYGRSVTYGFDGFIGDVVVERFCKTAVLGDQYTWTLYSPNSLDLVVYEQEQIDALDRKYKGKTLFISRPVKDVKGKPWQYMGVVSDMCENIRNSNQKDFLWKEDCIGWCNWCNNIQQFPVCAQIKNEDNSLYVNIDSIESFFVDEETFLKISESRNHNSYVDEFAEKYLNQKIHLESDKSQEHSYVLSYSMQGDRILWDEIYKGDYYCDRIELCYPNRRDSVYYAYHSVLKKVGKKGVEDQELFCPISDFKLVNVELDSVYQERIKIEEMERRRIREEKYLKQELEEQQEKAQYHKMLVKKYGKTNAKLIEEGEVRIGFTKEMCIEAWGEPEYINTTTTADGKTEQWVYGWFSYLYFNGNKLIAIQDQE